MKLITIKFKLFMVSILSGLIGSLTNSGVVSSVTNVVSTPVTLSSAFGYTNSLVATYNTKVPNIQVFIGT